MALKLNDLKDRGKYRAAVQKAAKAVGAKPVDFWVFEGFTFADGKPGWVLLLGPDLTEAALVNAVKDADTVVRSRGKCAQAGGGLEFLPSMGKPDFAKFKADVGSLQMTQVRAFTSAKGAGDDAGAAGTLKELAALRGQRDQLARAYAGQKSKMSDAQRKAADTMFAAAAKRLAAEPPTKDDILAARSTLANIERTVKFAADTLPALRKAFEAASKAFAAGRADLSDAAQRDGLEVLRQSRLVLEAHTLDASRAGAAQAQLDDLAKTVLAYQKGRKLQQQLMKTLEGYRAEAVAGRKALEAHVKALSQPASAEKAVLAIGQSVEAAQRLLGLVQGVPKAFRSAALLDTRDLVPTLEAAAAAVLAQAQGWVKDARAAAEKGRSAALAAAKG